jgi:hypothetical protein
LKQLKSIEGVAVTVPDALDFYSFYFKSTHDADEDAYYVSLFKIKSTRDADEDTYYVSLFKIKSTQDADEDAYYVFLNEKSTRWRALLTRGTGSEAQKK